MATGTACRAPSLGLATIASAAKKTIDAVEGKANQSQQLASTKLRAINKLMLLRARQVNQHATSIASQQVGAVDGKIHEIEDNVKHAVYSKDIKCDETSEVVEVVRAFTVDFTADWHRELHGDPVLTCAKIK